MKVTIILRPGGMEKTVELTGTPRIIEALRKAEIPPDVTICMMNGSPVPVDTPLKDGDRFEAVTVVSGG